MNLIHLVLENGGEAVIGQIARKIGLPEHQTNQLLAQVLPALGQGIKRNLADSEQRRVLVETLTKERPQQVLDRPELLEQDDSIVARGNTILGQLFGGKEVSRAVASKVAGNTGTEPDIVKRLLPLAATLAMGALGKETEKRGSSGPGRQTGEESTIVTTFMEFLDMDDDGDVLDDVFTIAKKFL